MRSLRLQLSVTTDIGGYGSRIALRLSGTTLIRISNSRGHKSAFPRREVRPGCARKLSLERKEGAGKAGCPMHPQPRVQVKKHTSIVTTGSPVTPGLPCALVLTAYSVLSPATNSSCHRRRRIKVLKPGRALRTSADLTPATGARTTRFCRPQQRRSSCAILIAHRPKPALRSIPRGLRRRVHRIPSQRS